MDYRTWLAAGALLGLTGVALGAFGAHGLAARLTELGRTATFETAVKYHLIHAVALVALAAVAAAVGQPTAFNTAGILLTIGTLVFSGALYILAIFDVRFMGAIAPIGGVLLLAGWGLLLLGALRLPAPAGT